MKIEKGKLYYDGVKVFKAISDSEDDIGAVTDKIAVHCPTKDDKLYVSKNYSLETIGKSSSDYILINEDDACGKGYLGFIYYHIITIDQFKEFYPPQVDQDEYSWVNNGLQDVPVKKIDRIVKIIIDKYQQRSRVGIKKYGTTLEDNEDGIEIFLTHLQEEMMDATLYIEKLKHKFANLKKHL